MTYHVVLMMRAENDLQQIFEYIRSTAPRAAEEWLKRAMRSIERIAHHPARCPLAPESATFDLPIRQLLFDSGNRRSYRFLFVVLDDSVYVVHVRHGSMLPLSPGD